MGMGSTGAFCMDEERNVRESFYWPGYVFVSQPKFVIFQL